MSQNMDESKTESSQSTVEDKEEQNRSQQANGAGNGNQEHNGVNNQLSTNVKSFDSYRLQKLFVCLRNIDRSLESLSTTITIKTHINTLTESLRKL